ncbi:hypothetical protein LCGC14_0372630 [marine sediment metagenome]|uniref:Uncharacterized protein n=1 Tax=marine sediment metagenome TaxID=412755 RepID=A0A0F9TMS5_9ZZZZ
MAELLEPSVARQRQLLGFPLVDADIATGANINAAKIGTGVVSNTEFDRLNGITSALEEQGNKGAVSGYAGLDASQKLLLTNFPSGTGLQVLRRNVGNTALEFATLADLQGITSINADTTAAQVLAGTASRISVVDAGATHTFDIDAAYVGQASITTLGTITTGVWNGTAITGANINAASTDLTDSAVIVRTDQVNTYTAGARQDFLGLLAGTAGLNVGGIAGNPTTQVDADIWYNSTSNTLFGRINGANVDLGATGGEVFTWTADHSMATFKLTANAGNNVILNAPTTQSVELQVAATQEYLFSATALTMNNNDLEMGTGTIEFGIGESIGIESNDMVFDVTASDFFKLDIGGSTEYLFSSGNLNVFGNGFINVGDMSFDDAKNISFNTTTGTKIGTATTQKIGFWNATPVVQQAHIADPTGGGTIDAEARTAINSILGQMATTGMQAAS